MPKKLKPKSELVGNEKHNQAENFEQVTLFMFDEKLRKRTLLDPQIKEIEKKVKEGIEFDKEIQDKYYGKNTIVDQGNTSKNTIVNTDKTGKNTIVDQGNTSKNTIVNPTIGKNTIVDSTVVEKNTIVDSTIVEKNTIVNLTIVDLYIIQHIVLGISKMIINDEKLSHVEKNILLAILYNLPESDYMGISKLSNLTGISPKTLNNSLKSLVERGIINRDNSKNPRAKNYYLDKIIRRFYNLNSHVEMHMSIKDFITTIYSNSYNDIFSSLYVSNIINNINYNNIHNIQAEDKNLIEISKFKYDHFINALMIAKIKGFKLPMLNSNRIIKLLNWFSNGTDIDYMVIGKYKKFISGIYYVINSKKNIESPWGYLEKALKEDYADKGITDEQLEIIEKDLKIFEKLISRNALDEMSSSELINAVNRLSLNINLSDKETASEKRKEISRFFDLLREEIEKKVKKVVKVIE